MPALPLAAFTLTAFDAIGRTEVLLAPVPLAPIRPPAPLGFDLGWCLVLTRF